MEKPRILISCNPGTLVLADRLRDELHKHNCDTALWSDDPKNQSSVALLDLLDSAAEQFDFAAIVLVKDDVKPSAVDDPLGTRDTYDFQAGLFMAKIGRGRCFLVDGAGPNALSSHLGGIISIPFEEPRNLQDRAACGSAVVRVAAQLKERVAELGNSPYYVRVPNLSVAEVWRKERPLSQGGELRQGEVIVCETQPLPQESLAIQVRRNMDNDISYTYFLHLGIDTIEKICRSLQVVLVAGVADDKVASDFTSRMSVVKDHGDRILQDLHSICTKKRLRVALMLQEPAMSFRIHNASNRDLAKLYARYRDQCFIPWSEGVSAESVWLSLPSYLLDSKQDCLFVSLKFENKDEQENILQSSLDTALGRYFPGIEADVKKLLVPP